MRSLGTVLLGEDEEHDVFFMRKAFDLLGISNPLTAVPTGREVIRYLQGAEEYADRSRHPEPGLLLLDLKMPLVDGFEVLSWVQQNDTWRDHLPVLVFSSSAQDQDKRRAFELGAHEYLVKPSNFRGLLTLVKDLKRRWLEPSGALHSDSGPPAPDVAPFRSLQ